MSKENTSKFTRFVGHAVVGCFFACLCAIVIALTVRFISWIF